MIFDVKMETLPREELRALQLARLRDLCNRLYYTVPFYTQKFGEMGLKPEDVRSLDDLKRLPFTTKNDLRASYPYKMFAVPLGNVVRLHASSGTTGSLSVVGATHRDIENWAELVARSMVAAGVTGQDIIHVAYGYGLFTGGLGAHYGAERLGATVIPASSGSTRRQVQLMRDFGATALACTPSYALHINDTAMEEGFDLRDKSVFKLRTGIFGAEFWSEEMRHTIETSMGINAMNIYGLSEIMGPGVAMECLEAKEGLHVWEDHFLVEIIDPDTGENLPDGEEGELVITTLTREAVPLIRYRTRDVTRLISAPCKCGRTCRRLDRIRGRSDDMLIIRGVNVFPSQIEAILMETPGLTPHYLIVVDRVGQLDTMEIQVELDESYLAGGEIKRLEEMTRKLTRRIKEFLAITPHIRIVEPRTISRSEGKAKRVIDNRRK